MIGTFCELKCVTGWAALATTGQRPAFLGHRPTINEFFWDAGYALRQQNDRH
jgi:hypothetical protein